MVCSQIEILISLLDIPREIRMPSTTAESSPEGRSLWLRKRTVFYGLTAMREPHPDHQRLPCSGSKCLSSWGRHGCFCPGQERLGNRCCMGSRVEDDTKTLSFQRRNKCSGEHHALQLGPPNTDVPETPSFSCPGPLLRLRVREAKMTLLEGCWVHGPLACVHWCEAALVLTVYDPYAWFFALTLLLPHVECNITMSFKRFLNW